MMRSLYAGVAGLKTHQTRMDVIVTIRNVNTIATKSQSMTFSELMYQTHRQHPVQATTGVRDGYECTSDRSWIQDQCD